MTEFLPARQSSSDAFAQLCAAVPSACVNILDAICGADDENFNLTRLPEYLVNTPAGEGLDRSPHSSCSVRNTAAACSVAPCCASCCSYTRP